jgi:7-cyano-7-deazaguanine synthase in queuosine biosynthesis
MPTAKTLILSDIGTGTGRCPWRIEFQIDNHHVNAYFRPAKNSNSLTERQHISLIAIPILIDLTAQVRPKTVKIAKHLQLPNFDCLFNDAAGALLNEQDAFWSRSSFTHLPRLFYNTEKRDSPRYSLNQKRAVLGFSGGKDSIVSLHALAQAGYEVIPILLNVGDRTWQDVRKWIPRLRGAGFRPLTNYLLPCRRKPLMDAYGDWYYSSYEIGWLVIILALYAVSFRAAHIVLGIEHSADVNHSLYHNRKINHQHQKTTGHLKLLREFLQRALHPDLSISSPIAHLSDTAVLDALLNHIPRSFQAFSSCGSSNWQSKFCCKCDKCAFVYSLLRASNKGGLLAKKLFRKNLFNDIELYRPWIDARYNTVLACVGSRQEVWNAFESSVKKGCNSPVIEKWKRCSLRKEYIYSPIEGISPHLTPLCMNIVDAAQLVSKMLANTDDSMKD